MFYPNDIEDLCYDQSHVNMVLVEIKKSIPNYFQQYLETEGGSYVTDGNVKKLAEIFGSTSKPKTKIKDNKKLLENLMNSSIKTFNDDRKSYQEILALDALSEFKLDVPSFKNKVLRDQIPIIRKTLQNKAAKELDKYRKAFKNSQPGDLFNVVQNIVTLADTWRKEQYDSETFEKISSCDEMDYHKMDEENYTEFGVIGGGIKSHFIYKLFPEMYPNRSRESVWALWYLSDKKRFDCKQDSEFLMINTKESTTQQNYFYPYGLFAYYALQIYTELKILFYKHNVIIPTEYRFVVVDAFMSFVSRQHQQEIDLLKQSSENYHYDH